MMRRLTDAHKDKLAAGRQKRADALREAGALRAALFCEWSEKYAQGKMTLRDCPFEPSLASDLDFDYAREAGLID